MNPHHTPSHKDTNAKARTRRGVANTLGVAFALTAIGFSAQSCGRPNAVEHDSKANAVVLPWLAWEVYVLGAAVVGGAGLIIVNQGTGEQKQYTSNNDAESYISDSGGTVVMRHQANGSNPNAMARPSAGGSAVPMSIGSPCNKQNRPERESCEESICYVSPSAANAAAARRIHSHRIKKSKDNCFVFQWPESKWGLDQGHDWVQHFHLYEVDSWGMCVTNAHFYILKPDEFENYKGRCKKY